MGEKYYENEYGKTQRKMAFIQALNKARREKWDKINDRFERNDSPAGSKLTAVGCMKRFDNTRDEQYMDPGLSRARECIVSVGLSSVERQEQANFDLIDPSMTMDEMAEILNKEESPYDF